MAEKKQGDSGSADEVSMSDRIKDAKGVDAAEVREVTTVQSTTKVMPAEADKSSLPNAMDAQSEDPPVRAAKPDTPIAQTLAAGAGEHTPPDPEEFAPSGRPREIEES